MWLCGLEWLDVRLMLSEVLSMFVLMLCAVKVFFASSMVIYLVLISWVSSGLLLLCMMVGSLISMMSCLVVCVCFMAFVVWVIMWCLGCFVEILLFMKWKSMLLVVGSSSIAMWILL